MAHNPRAEMIAETRAKLVTAARKAFGTIGYTEASMDDFTDEAGLVRPSWAIRRNGRARRPVSAI